MCFTACYPQNKYENKNPVVSSCNNLSTVIELMGKFLNSDSWMSKADSKEVEHTSLLREHVLFIDKWNCEHVGYTRSSILDIDSNRAARTKQLP